MWLKWPISIYASEPRCKRLISIYSSFSISQYNNGPYKLFLVNHHAVHVMSKWFAKTNVLFLIVTMLTIKKYGRITFMWNNYSKQFMVYTTNYLDIDYIESVAIVHCNYVGTYWKINDNWFPSKLVTFLPIIPVYNTIITCNLLCEIYMLAFRYNHWC